MTFDFFEKELKILVIFLKIVTLVSGGEYSI